MDRRSFLKLLSTGIIGYELDVDKLLWVPGQKKLFVMSNPIKHISEMDIVAAELNRIIPHLADIFDSDDIFYKDILRPIK